MVDWPDWWEWEFEISGHVLDRMIDRQFSETDLRLMLADASGYHPDVVEDGRWVVETQSDGRNWEIIVEPIPNEQIVMIITAYPVD